MGSGGVSDVRETLRLAVFRTMLRLEGWLRVRRLNSISAQSCPVCGVVLEEECYYTARGISECRYLPPGYSDTAIAAQGDGL